MLEAMIKKKGKKNEIQSDFPISDAVVVCRIMH